MSAYVAGVGMTSFEDETKRSILNLAGTAAERAIADADRERDEVTSVHLGNALAEATGTTTGLANAFVSALGMEGTSADRIENTSATGASAAHRGIEAVVSGSSDIALVVGVEKMSSADTDDTTDVISRLTHDREYAQGVTLPSFGGLAAGTYLDRYDAPREALAAVAKKNHGNASTNPVAQFQRQVSIDDAMDAPRVADPLRLYDCCPMTDGAAALVLVDEPTDVRVAGFASATDTHAVAARDDILAMGSVRESSRRAFERADRGPADVDVACIHDAFTILELLELEEIGFYEPGTAWQATMDGETARDGDLPVNPGGGLKARGHPLGATGVSQLIEIVWQLRGDLRPTRQVSDATTGFAVNVAGFGNNSVSTVLEAT